MFDYTGFISIGEIYWLYFPTRRNRKCIRKDNFLPPDHLSVKVKQIQSPIRWRQHVNPKYPTIFIIALITNNSEAKYLNVLNLCVVFVPWFSILIVRHFVPPQTRGRLRLKCDGTCAETRFRLSAKQKSPFKSAGGVTSVDCWQPRCAHQR